MSGGLCRNVLVDWSLAGNFSAPPSFVPSFLDWWFVAESL